MIKATLDYETRSKVDLKAAGATRYAKDPSTSIICVGYKINDQLRRLWIPERAPMPTDLWEVIKSGMPRSLVAHNAGFERAITKYTLTRYSRLTPSQIATLSGLTPRQWRCTAAKAAAVGFPRKLENACMVAGLETQKDKEGHRLMLKYSKPRKPSKNNSRIWWNDAGELRKIYQYCLTDVQAEFELDETLPDLMPAEQEVWELNEKINERGILIDVPTVKIILRLIAEEKKNIQLQVQELSCGAIENATQTAKVLAWVNNYLNNEGYIKRPSGEGAMHNLQAQTLRDKLEGDLPREVRMMLEYRQASSRTSTSKYTKMLQAVDDDHRARDLILYYGAMTTGRFSGQRIQPQNFPRPTPELNKLGFTSDEAIELIKTGGLDAIRKRYGAGRVMEVFGCCTRGMLIPTPGYEFFCADFAAIEARLAFWVAALVTGIDTGLKEYQEGKKIYEEMAAYVFGVDLEWLCSKEGKESLERFIGKESILGCQYGLGWQKFLTQAHKKGQKAVTPQIAKKAVDGYRSKYREIPLTWKALERTIIEAILNRGEKYKLGNLKIYCTDDFLIIRLPTGRKIRYADPRVVRKQNRWGKMQYEIRHWAWDWALNPETGKPHKTWVEIVSWGGVFFNNVIQGLARELMVAGIKGIENASYRFLLSVHDEGLSECKIGKGSVDEYVKLLTENLGEWARGAPIKAEGWKGMRYRK